MVVIISLVFLLAVNPSISTFRIRKGYSLTKIISSYNWPQVLQSSPSHQNKLYSVVSNWNEVVSPFTEGGCLIHVTTFNTLLSFSDFPPTHPLISRSLHSAIANFFTEHRDTNGAFSESSRSAWIIKTIHLPKNITQNMLSTCPTYFDHGEISAKFAKICVELDYSKFTLSTKPWNCEVRIGVNPPGSSLQVKSVHRSLTYPFVWHYDTNDKGQEHFRSFPSRIPPVNVIITDMLMQDSFDRTGKFFAWVKMFFEETFDPNLRKVIKLQMANDIFLIFQVSGDKVHYRP